jgi:hypothetical protein
MFLVEGGMSFDTRNAVAGARAFQRELKATGKVAEEASKAGKSLEKSFKASEARGALRGLQVQLMNIKDGTDAAVAGAKALQIALVKSVAGTAIIGAAGVLSDSIRDVGIKIGAAADEASRATKGFSGFAQSLDEGRQRADTLTQSADNTLKSLEAMKNAGIFQAGVFKLFGGEDVLKDLEEATRGLAGEEFRSGAAAGRRTAERRVGMTPEQIAADIRKEEEQKRLREAETKGGAGARADVQRTIDAENEQKRREDASKSQKTFEKDIASTQEKIAQIQEAQAKSIEQKRLDALVPTARIVELDKESAKVSERIAEITRTGIYGAEEARKKQLEEIVALEQRSVDLANQKSKALQEQKNESEALKTKAEDEATAKRNVEIEERKRARESGRSRKENQAFLRQAQEQLRQKSLEEQLARFFGSGAWDSIPDNIKNQMLIQGVSNQHLSAISRNTQPSGGGGGYSMQGTRFGRPKSGPGMERPPGYVPSPQGVDKNFGEFSMPYGGFGYNPERFGGAVMRGGRPSTVSADNPYKRTRIRGEQSGGGDLASAIKALADKIPSAVPQ